MLTGKSVFGPWDDDEMKSFKIALVLKDYFEHREEYEEDEEEQE